MKKISVFTLICVMILTLCACGNKSGAENPSFNSNSASDENMCFITTNADYYENGVVFGNDKAMFLDFDTMDKVPLCAVPNCTHNTASCLAVTIGTEPIFYNNYIYFFVSNSGVKEKSNGREFYIDSKLLKASIDSSEIETVCTFTDCAPPERFGKYVLRGNELYFVGDDMCPKEDEYGVISYSNIGGTHYLCSINLDTGKYTNYGSIYDGDKEYEMADASSGGNITGIQNGKMYIGYGFVKDRETAETKTEPFTFLNFEFDFNTKSWIESELPFSRYMNEDTYTYYNSDENKLHILYKGKEVIIDNDDEYAITSISEFNAKLFVPGKGKWYDLVDSSEHSLGEYSGYEIVGYQNGSYILIKGNSAVKLTDEELLAL